MTREQVRAAFNECKKAAGLDFALTQGIRDCMTCTNYELSCKYGKESRGIWLKWFRVGMNRSNWNERTAYFIVHDLTKEQGAKVMEVLQKHFKVEWDGSEHQCIKIESKEVVA